MTNKELKILSKVFDEMPNEFESHKFNYRCRELGLQKSLSKSGQVNKWLIKKTQKLSRYKYIKNDILFEYESNELENAIEICKKYGYKVLKPITEFREI